MAASQDVKVMSPQETSRWCSSLALCGVRGRILRDLQDQIIRRQIDGLLFDKILRSNGLQDLGIEELNPRLALAIRRSWTTDFSGVSFVDFESSRDHQQKQMQQQQQQQQQQQVQQPHHMRDSDNIFGGRGATAMGSSNHGVPQRHWNGPASPPNSSSAGRGPPFGTSESWGDRRGSNAQDPASRLGNGTSDGPVHSPQLRRGGFTEPATQPAIDHQIGDSQGYPSQNQHLVSPNHRPPPHVLPGYPGDADYGADGPVPARHAEVRRGYPSRYDHRMDDGLPDGPADSRRGYPQADYRANDLDLGSHAGHPLPGHGQARGFRPEFSDRADRGFRSRLDYTGGDLDMGLDSRGQGSRMAISPSGSPGQPLQMGPPERESADFHSNDHRAMNSRVSAPETGWGRGGASGGSGLGDTFLPRGPAATSYQTANAYDSVRRPPGAGGMQEEAWGGSLDDLMPPRQRLPPNVAQTQAEQARLATRAERNRPPGPDDWGGMSLGDALARPRGGRTQMQTQLDQELEDPRSQEWDRGQERERERQRERDLDLDPEADPRPSSIRERVEEGERDFDAEVEVLVPSWPPPSRGGDSAAPMGSGPPRGGRGGGGAGGGVETVLPQSRGRAPGSRAPGPASDDGWGGQSLGDALAPRRAAAPQGGPGAAGGGTSSSGSRGQRGGRTATPAASTGGAQCDKTPEQIVAWLQSLPESHVPEKARSHIATVVEAEGLGGMQFSQYVQQVPPEVCAPKHAMKLKAAWANVLKEAAAKEVALSNLASQPKQKATMLVV